MCGAGWPEAGLNPRRQPAGSSPVIVHRPSPSSLPRRPTFLSTWGLRTVYPEVAEVQATRREPLPPGGKRVSIGFSGGKDTMTDRQGLAGAGKRAAGEAGGVGDGGDGAGREGAGCGRKGRRGRGRSAAAGASVKAAAATPSLGRTAGVPDHGRATTAFLPGRGPRGARGPTGRRAGYMKVIWQES